MFTGIITHIGNIESISRNQKHDLLLEISLAKKEILRKLDIGCSIACNGICLTLIKKISKNLKTVLSFQASDETCNKTTIINWKKNQPINLEFALRVGDELGGHMVLGHVDAKAKIQSIKKVKQSNKFTFLAPKELMKFIVEKGSITIDGVSLTVNQVAKNSFSVNIIPHTLTNTAFSQAKVGDLVNLEIDAMARYAAKILKK